jgi:hypothetical protein
LLFAVLEFAVSSFGSAGASLRCHAVRRGTLTVSVLVVKLFAEISIQFRGRVVPVVADECVSVLGFCSASALFRVLRFEIFVSSRRAEHVGEV